MPAILIRILAWAMAGVASRMLFSLGLGILSFQAIDSLFDYLEGQIAVWFYGTSENILIFLHIFEIDFYISVLLSAMSVNATIKAASIVLGRS